MKNACGSVATKTLKIGCRVIFRFENGSLKFKRNSTFLETGWQKNCSLLSDHQNEYITIIPFRMRCQSKQRTTKIPILR